MKQKDILSKIPSTEIEWTEYLDRDEIPIFLVTSKESRDFYFLYEILNGGFKRLGKAISPIALEEKYKVIERMRNNAK
jgi:hypothetical protein